MGEAFAFGVRLEAGIGLRARGGGEDLTEREANRRSGDLEIGREHFVEALAIAEKCFPSLRVEGPDVFDTHVEIIADFAMEALKGVFLGEDLDAEKRSLTHNAIDFVVGAKDHDVRDAKVCGGDLQAELGNGDDVPVRCMRAETEEDLALQICMLELAQVALLEVTIYVVTIGIVDSVQVLLESDCATVVLTIAGVIELPVKVFVPGFRTWRALDSGSCHSRIMRRSSRGGYVQRCGPSKMDGVLPG